MIIKCLRRNIKCYGNTGGGVTAGEGSSTVEEQLVPAHEIDQVPGDKEKRTLLSKGSDEAMAWIMGWKTPLV